MHLISVRRETFDVLAGGPALGPHHVHRQAVVHLV